MMNREKHFIVNMTQQNKEKYATEMNCMMKHYGYIYIYIHTYKYTYIYISHTCDYLHKERQHSTSKTKTI